MSVKIAVFAPMPSASDRIATVANNGLRRSPRKANRKSPPEVAMCALTRMSGGWLTSGARRLFRRHACGDDYKEGNDVLTGKFTKGSLNTNQVGRRARRIELAM